MEKNQQGASGMHSIPPSAPPPSAPPSYEEAIGFTSGIANPPMNSVPYPIQGSSMPMPAQVTQPTAQMFPSNQPHTNPQLIFPSYGGNGQQNIVPPPELRIVQHRCLAPLTSYTLGPNAVKMSCPTCHANIKSSTVADHRPSAHICCIILCLFGCCLCSCLPYCMTAFMNVHHFCPNCKSYIGTWKG